MKKLSKDELKAVKGGIGPVYYCRKNSNCPSVCEMGGIGPEIAYFCAGRVCQLQVCG